MRLGPKPNLPHPIHARRIQRLLTIIREIRDNPGQDMSGLLERLGISRTQFYKDRKVLDSVGFGVTYHAGSGFRIVRDAVAPSLDLALSDRLPASREGKHFPSWPAPKANHSWPLRPIHTRTDRVIITCMFSRCKGPRSMPEPITSCIPFPGGAENDQENRRPSGCINH